MNEWPTNLAMTSLSAVKGGSLEKMCLIKEEGDERVYIVRAPTLLELQGNCDQCARQHQKTNTRCSMWLKRPTYATAEGELYDPSTKKIIYGWRLAEVETRRHSRIVKETYVRE